MGANDAAAGAGDTKAGESAAAGTAAADAAAAAAAATAAAAAAGAGGETGKAGEAAAGAAKTGDAAAGAAAAEPKAPETYTLTLPENGHLDADDLKRIEAIARPAAWSNEDAQAHVNDINAGLIAQSEAFLATTKADKDYGGDKLADTQRLAQLAIAKVRPEGHTRRASFLAFMNRGGAGNHIEVLSFLADLGKLIGEDRGPGAGRQGGGGGEKDAASVLYDHPTSQALNTATKR